MSVTINITKPAEAKEGLHGILYGPPKTGKTTTLDDPKFKVLHLDLEGGSSVLQDAENVQRIDIIEGAKENNMLPFEFLTEVLKQIESGLIHEFDLYALDSLTRYETMVKEYIALKYAPRRAREIQGKFGAQADWGDLKSLIVRNVEYVHSLTKRGPKSVHFLWVAHSLEEVDDITKQPKNTKIALQGKNTAETVMSIVDAIFYMYNRTVNEGTPEEPKWRIERGIYTRQAGALVAGVRQSKKKKPIDGRIVAPTWSDIFTKLGYVKA